MNDDDLRARLAALDPEAGRPVAPLTARQKENAMKSNEARAAATMAAACVAVAGVGIGAALVFKTTPHEATTSTPPPVGKKTVLELTKAPTNITAMCVPVADALPGAVHAFEGTVTSVEGGTVSFDVTHWYKGGDQQVVTLTSEDPSTVEDGIAFDEGKTYLVAAGESDVNGCSGTGEETPELKKLFDETF